MKSNKTRERILDVALQLFNEKKASNVSTVQISAAMKISPGNLYYYYANKEEVIRCIWTERMLRGMEALLQDCEKIETAEALLDFIKEGLKHILEYKFFYTEMSTLFVNDERLVEMHECVRKQMVGRLRDLYERWLQEGKTTEISESCRHIMIENGIALSHKTIASYEVAASRGIRFEEFIRIAWLHLASFLKPYFTDRMKQEMDDELVKRGVNESEYFENAGSTS